MNTDEDDTQIDDTQGHGMHGQLHEPTPSDDDSNVTSVPLLGDHDVEGHRLAGALNDPTAPKRTNGRFEPPPIAEDDVEGHV